MKKLLLILLCLPLIYSCEKQAPPPINPSPIPQASILGTWRLDSFYYKTDDYSIDTITGVHSLVNTDISTGSFPYGGFWTIYNNGFISIWNTQALEETFSYIIVNDSIYPNWNCTPTNQSEFYPFFAIDSLSNDFLSLSTEDYFEITTDTFYEWRYEWVSFIKDTSVSPPPAP